MNEDKYKLLENVSYDIDKKIEKLKKELDTINKNDPMYKMTIKQIDDLLYRKKLNNSKEIEFREVVALIKELGLERYKKGSKTSVRGFTNKGKGEVSIERLNKQKITLEFYGENADNNLETVAKAFKERGYEFYKGGDHVVLDTIVPNKIEENKNNLLEDDSNKSIKYTDHSNLPQGKIWSSYDYDETNSEEGYDNFYEEIYRYIIDAMLENTKTDNLRYIITSKGYGNPDNGYDFIEIFSDNYNLELENKNNELYINGEKAYLIPENAANSEIAEELFLTSYEFDQKLQNKEISAQSLLELKNLFDSVKL